MESPLLASVHPFLVKPFEDELSQAIYRQRGSQTSDVLTVLNLEYGHFLRLLVVSEKDDVMSIDLTQYDDLFELFI